jgi:NAD(P)-dependent dehydrogenase (short-subunit alcohol dehydrogenase family)
MSGLPSFDLRGRVAVVTGGYGILGGSLAEGLAAAGASVAVLGRNREGVLAKAAALKCCGVPTLGLVADVLDPGQIEQAREELLAAWGRVDVLINAAGGNLTAARTDHGPPFGMPLRAFDEVVKLNLHGTVYPTLAFAEAMARSGKGSVVNISSMAALQALSGVLGYSVAKAGIESFTRWLAVDLARRCGPGLRVNAIAPGFFIGNQNRSVLVGADGSFTERARAILSRTPMGRFGEPQELQGAVLWLASDAASFVTGTVIPIDGGFSADSGI